MCGIVGGISAFSFPWADAPACLHAAVDSLAHRGPDDRGVYLSDDGHAFLGHRRLSIIDIDGGHEPIADESGRRRISYNGEIYNYRRLRHELHGRGHVLTSRSDAEVPLHLYEEDPHEFVSRLDGMFAFGILDESVQALTIARDRNGIKPLYYAFDGMSMIFASELKAILPLLSGRPKLSVAGLQQFLRWKYIPSPLTIFEGIYKLPPGHVARASLEPPGERLRLDVRSYWRPDFGVPKLTDEAEALDRLDQTLRASIESHLIADVEVGALLSGGVDSSLVVALASQLSGRRIKTFSVGFQEAGFDQLPYARILADRYNTDHHEERIAADVQPLEILSELARQFDEPFADSSALACWRICQVASRHVKVVLTGDGGDESFAGYKRYDDLTTALSSDRPWRRGLRRFANRSLAAVFTPEAKFLRASRAASYPPLQQHEERQVLFTPWLANRLLACPYQNRCGENDGDRFHQLRAEALAAGWSPLDAAQYVDLRMYLPDDILAKVDRTGMACSLECRVPLLDHSITQFSAGLAPELKIHNGVRKYLLKRLAERYVPQELLYRPKMGFRVPIRRWFKRDHLADAAAALRGGRLIERGVLDADAVNWLFRAQARPWMDFGSQIWALLCLEFWARAYWT